LGPLALLGKPEDGGAGLVPRAGGPPDASFGFYLIEAFQSQTNTKYIIQPVVRH